MNVRVRAFLLLLPVALFGSGAGHAADCEAEAKTLVKDESDLPRLDVVSRADRPVLCITLETLIAFAGRLKTHMAHCPGSSFASQADTWEKTRIGYAKQFAQNRCKRTLFN
jgi:hypothetical protein